MGAQTMTITVQRNEDETYDFTVQMGCVVFGQPADTVEQRRKIVVPRILEAARLEEAVRTLRDVIDP